MTTERPRFTTAILFLIVAGGCLVGCGGKAVIDGDGGSGGATSTTGSTTSVSTSVGTTNTTNSSSTGMVEGVTLTLSNATYSAGCMPIIPDDPLYGIVTLSINNNTANTITVDAVLDVEVISSGGTTLYTSTGGGGVITIGPGDDYTDGSVIKPDNSATGDSGCVHCQFPTLIRGTMPTNLGPISGEIQTTVDCAF